MTLEVLETPDSPYRSIVDIVNSHLKPYAGLSAEVIAQTARDSGFDGEFVLARAADIVFSYAFDTRMPIDWLQSQRAIMVAAVHAVPDTISLATRNQGRQVEEQIASLEALESSILRTQIILQHAILEPERAKVDELLGSALGNLLQYGDHFQRAEFQSEERRLLDTLRYLREVEDLRMKVLKLEGDIPLSVKLDAISLVSSFDSDALDPQKSAQYVWSARLLRSVRIDSNLPVVSPKLGQFPREASRSYELRINTLDILDEIRARKENMYDKKAPHAIETEWSIYDYENRKILNKFYKLLKMAQEGGLQGEAALVGALHIFNTQLDERIYPQYSEQLILALITNGYTNYVTKIIRDREWSNLNIGSSDRFLVDIITAAGSKGEKELATEALNKISEYLSPGEKIRGLAQLYRFFQDESVLSQALHFTVDNIRRGSVQVFTDGIVDIAKSVGDNLDAITDVITTIEGFSEFQALSYEKQMNLWMQLVLISSHYAPEAYACASRIRDPQERARYTANIDGYV